MRHTASAAPLAALLLGSALLAAPGAARPMTFQCFAPGWDEKFIRNTPRIDLDQHRITWTLTARRVTEAPPSEAFFSDADGVEVGTVPVVYDPVRPVYKMGERVQAVVSLRGLTVEDICKLTVRPSP